MPRLSKDERMQSVSRLIWGAISTQGLSLDELTDKTGISRSTMFRRKANPETITLGELDKLVRFLHIPIEDVRNAIKI